MTSAAHPRRWVERLAVALPVTSPRGLVTGALALGALVTGIAATAALFQLSPAAPLVAVGAVAFTALSVLAPAGSLFVVGLLLPFEGFQIPLGSALGALSPARAALLVVAAGYCARALLWPERVTTPGLKDVPAVALLLSVLPGLVIGVSLVTVAKVELNWIAYFVVALAVRSMDGRGVRLVLLGLGAGGAVLGANGLINYLSSGGARISNGGAAVYGRAAAGLTDSNYYGGLLLLVLVPLLAVVVRERHRWRLPAAAAVAFGTAGLVLSLSRGAILALFLAVSVVLAAWSSSRRWTVALLVVLLATLSLNAGPLLHSREVQVVGQRLSSVSTSTTNNARPLLWKNSLDIMQRHPEGVGALEFVTQAEQRGLTEQGLPLEHAHNSYLNIGVELGLFGLLAFLALLAQSLLACWREYRRHDARTEALAVGLGAALVGYAFQSLTVSLYAVQLIHAVFFILVGASLGLARLRTPEAGRAGTV